MICASVYLLVFIRNLLVHLAEKILLLQPLTFGGDYRITYQFPEDIADGIRMISSCELWNEIAIRRGATVATKSVIAKGLKKDLSLVVERRNKIAHEGDLLPTTPRIPWPINRLDVDFAAQLIYDLVRDIDAIV